jgi:Flp pilus assembly protein TadD
MKTLNMTDNRSNLLPLTANKALMCALLSCVFLSTTQTVFAQTSDQSAGATVNALDVLPENAPASSEPAPVVVDESAVVKNSVVDAASSDDNVPSPPEAGLKMEEPANPPLTPLPQEDTADITGTNVMGDGGVEQKHSGTYYDADSLVPDSQLSGAGITGPRKVDPAYEPGGRFVVVERGGKATSYEAQYMAGTRALKLERFAAAMEIFEKLHNKDPDDPRVLMGLAVAQQGAGFSESAARTYENLLEVQPNNADAVVNLMGIMKAQYPAVTLRKLSELRDKYPSNAGIPAQMALINAETGEYQDALKFFEIAASMEPNNPSHIYNMAIVLDKKGDVKGAISHYERALLLEASYRARNETIPRDKIYDRLVVLRRKA